MPTTTVNHIFDPIGNRAINKPKPTLHWQYVNMCQSYAVQIEWLQNNQQQHSLHQQITMHCTGIQKEKAVWQINKQDFFINEQEPENVMDELAIACAEQFYPIQLLIDKSGQFDSVLNIEEIQQRFTENKPTLLEDFEGAVAEEYINDIDKMLDNHNHLLNNIQKELWLALFFNPIYTVYAPEAYNASMQIQFPFYDFERAIIFITEATVNFKPTDINANTLTCQGQLDTSQQFSKVVRDRQTPTAGSMNIIYHLNQHKHQIQNINGQVTIQTDNSTSQINISSYALNDGQIIEQNNTVEKQKPTGWCSFLFGN